jgi:hypothetical protein
LERIRNAKHHQGVGAPVSITAQEFRMECMFPAADESEKNYLELMAREGKKKK